jgi:DNA polymerase I-like protein with 3'-5' exonuclease and polymerase domains
MLTVLNPDAFDWENIPYHECIKGNAADSFFTLKIFELLYEQIKDTELETLYKAILEPSVPLFTEIESQGLKVDENKIDELERLMDIELIEIEDSLYSLKEVKNTYNLNATVDLVKILYSCERDKETKKWEIDPALGGFGLYPPKKTGKDAPSTDEETLNKLIALTKKEISKRAK